jgi:hypothetical protein
MALRTAADQFFDRLEALGEDLPSSSLFARLVPWVVSAAAVAVALDIASWQRRRRDPIAAQCGPDARDPRWASFLDLALAIPRNQYDD